MKLSILYSWQCVVHGVQCAIKLEMCIFSLWFRHLPKKEQKQDQDQENEREKEIKDKLRSIKNRSKSNLLEAGEGVGYAVVY